MENKLRIETSKYNPYAKEAKFTISNGDYGIVLSQIGEFTKEEFEDLCNDILKHFKKVAIRTAEEEGNMFDKLMVERGALIASTFEIREIEGE